MTEGLEKELLGAILYHGEDPHIFEELWPISQKIQPEDFGDPLRMAIYSEMRERIIGSQPITAPGIQEVLSGVPQDDLMREVSSLIIAYENGGKKKLRQLLAEVSDTPLSGSKRKIQYPQAITSRELIRLDLPPVQWLVDRILTVGLSIIGAPPKSYKSYMALQLCYSIASGGEFLGFQCHKKEALYLDLESGLQRPKVRLLQMFGKEAAIDGLHILTAKDGIRRIEDGFEEQVRDQLKQHPNIGFICVDVFQRIKAAGKKNQNAYESDYAGLEVLKRLAEELNLGIMLIHHTRKAKDGDIFNQLAGSTAIFGAMDCSLMVEKVRGSDEATLHITGRDIESRELKILFNKERMQWESLGAVDVIEQQRRVFAYEQSDIVYCVKKLISQGNGHWEGSAEDIKNASKYFDSGAHKIYNTPSQIGKEINIYIDLFLGDGIRCRVERSNSKRFYVFDVTPVTDVTGVTGVTDVTGVQCSLSGDSA